MAAIRCDEAALEVANEPSVSLLLGSAMPSPPSLGGKAYSFLSIAVMLVRPRILGRSSLEIAFSTPAKQSSMSGSTRLTKVHSAESDLLKAVMVFV
jgi:hypothetical protein